VIAANQRGGIAGTTTVELKIKVGEECDEAKMINKIANLSKYMHRQFVYNEQGEFALVKFRYSSNRKVRLEMQASNFLKHWKAGVFPGSTGVTLVKHPVNPLTGTHKNNTHKTSQFSPFQSRSSPRKPTPSRSHSCPSCP
jgi:hypothetical protein